VGVIKMSSWRNPAHRPSSSCILGAVVAAAWLLMAGLLASCSGGAQQETRGDTEAAGVTPARLTREQCLAGREIQRAAAPSDNEGYLIQPGDVLASIGSEGALKNLIAANPQLRDVDMIYPGEVVHLPVESDAQE
jgi:hypothetical protein